MKVPNHTSQHLSNICKENRYFIEFSINEECTRRIADEIAASQDNNLNGFYVRGSAVYKDLMLPMPYPLPIKFIDSPEVFCSYAEAIEYANRYCPEKVQNDIKNVRKGYEFAKP